MKKRNGNLGGGWLVALCIMALTSVVPAQTSLAIVGGLSTPNDQINNVYNSSIVTDNASKTWNTLRGSTSLGYDLAARLRFPLSSKFLFSGGIGFSRFPQSDIDVKDPNNGTVLTTLHCTENIIPVSAGVEYVLFRTIASPYVAVDLQYNYIASTVDYELTNGVNVPINADKAPVDSRVGAAIGGGLMINAVITTLNVDVRYNVANIIGKTTEEQTKSYLTLNVGVCFGGSGSSSK